MNNLLISIGIYLAVMIFLSLIAYIQTKKINIFDVAVCIIAFLLDLVLLTLPSIPFLKYTQWNWQGKILESILGIILILILSRRIKPENFGFTFKVQTGGWKFFWVATLLICILSFVQVFFGTKLGMPNLETFLFELTMPGIAEEIVYRGLILGLLNHVFGRNFQLFGVRFGWGSIISSVIFGMVHGLNPETLAISFFPLISTAIIGFLFCILTEKSKSIWPSILMHNITNTFNIFLI
jgi:uncharacterized protein